MRTILKITRQSVIEDLINNDFEICEQDETFMRDIMSDGFKGYHSYTDKQLFQDWIDFIWDGMSSDYDKVEYYRGDTEIGLNELPMFEYEK